MRLAERSWALAGGAGGEWRAVTAVRTARAKQALRETASALSKRRLPELNAYRLDDSIRFLLASPAAIQEKILSHPGFDSWVTASLELARRPDASAEWSDHFPFFQSFAAACAKLRGVDRDFPIRLTRESRFHLTGIGEYFEVPGAPAQSSGRASVRQGLVSVQAAGRRGSRRTPTAVAQGIAVEFQDPLITSPITVHGLALPTRPEERRFARVLSSAFDAIKETDPLLWEEMSDMVRLLIPLRNPAGFGSVSSSYQNLRGAIGLSHAGDSLLQEETLIHEFCHQKINLLLGVDKLLEPGQFGKVFYSPWRPDPRRLQGLLLGAHAFLNVSRHLLSALSRRPLSQETQVALMLNVSRRLFQIETALRTVSGYATMTPFGAKLNSCMWRELTLLHHETQRFPPIILDAARKQCREHRVKYCLFETGLHRPEGFTPVPTRIKVDAAVLARKASGRRSKARGGQK